jgi:hypothetical protein
MKRLPRGADIIASIRFYTKAEGGRQQAPSDRLFRCPLEFEDEKFDCGLYFNECDPFSLGTWVMVPIEFLSPGLIKPRLAVGSRFTLWEIRTIAEGVVEQILPSAK